MGEAKVLANIIKMDNRAIGIFDSGIGGLTVLKELKERLPNEEFIYLGDTLNFPYGGKTKEEIVELSKKNIKYLIRQNVKLIVIACGTATSQSLEEVRKVFDVPIIGIIEPTVQYIQKLKIEKVGVMATVGTIRSGSWESNLKKKIHNIEVVNQACPLLANIVEEGKIESQESINAINNYVQIFKENKIKNIILGCTHYPLYDEIIKREFNYDVNLINTGKAVATYLEKFIKENNIEKFDTIESTNNTRKLSEMEIEKEKHDRQVPKIIISKEEIDFYKKAKNILNSDFLYQNM